jgi:hypothetical protein
MSELTFDLVLEKIKNNEPFSFARYGDGEWNCILEPNNNKGNCDGHKYFTDLSLSLQNVLKSKPKYFLGMQNHALRINGDNINKFIADNNLQDIEWSNADIFHKASIHNEFNKFFEVIKNKQVILVAPEYLQILKLGKVAFNIPAQDCWLKKDEIVEWLKGILPTEYRGMIIIFCASMAANVMVDELYNWNQNHTYLDMGSVFDPYVKVAKRSYHKAIIERENKK